jgi:Ca2+-binding RTX toxin-like protein
MMIASSGQQPSTFGSHSFWGAIVSIRYISPTGSGTGDGSSWANAAKISQLSTMISKAGPGGQVLLAADQGAYYLKSSIAITASGADEAPVTIRGVDAAGQDLAAQIIGTRNVAAGIDGLEVFRLGAGANNLTFENLDFTNVGNGAFRVAGDLKNLVLRHMDATNVQRFFENLISSTNKTATIDGLTIQDVEVRGYSKGAIHLQYDTHNVLIEGVIGDSEKQAHDDFAMGVMLEGSVHDVIVRNTSMDNSYNSTDAYWNGDGFATEGRVYRVRFENTSASGNTDGGYDIKSTDTVLINAYASGNKRNFRFWSDSITMVDSTGVDPHRQGGTGSEAQVWLADNAKAVIADSSFLNTDGATVFELSSRALLTLQGDITYTGVGATYSKTWSGSQIVVSAEPAPATTALTASLSIDQALDGDAAANTIDGGVGADSVRGMDGNDLVLGGAGADDVNGNVGADTVRGGDGNDAFVRGGQDNDQVYGDAGDDPHVNGNKGNDLVYGGIGNDTVYGGEGADTVYGDEGADWVSGDLGNDILYGGRGADRFLFRTGSGADWVADFNAADGDRIQLAVGTAYTVASVGGQPVITLTGGATIGLAGVASTSFSSDWVVFG